MKKIFISTFGCKVNQYESQLIRELFEKNGYVCVNSPEEADTIIINSCTVTDSSDRQCNSFINKFLHNNKEIILTGCYAKTSYDKIKKEFPKIKIILKEDLFKNTIQTIKSFDNHSRAFIKIQDGCNCFCSYCIVPFARNMLWSKPEDEIIREISAIADNGYTEIVLTGIHIGKYENGISRLLKKILGSLKKDFRIRLSSIEVNEVDDELISIMKDEPLRICNHLHIPLQSASDNVLKQMNRKYTLLDFDSVLKKLKKNIPDISLTTDVICGFPCETADDFEQTRNFLKNAGFARLHVFPYSKRQGTKAFELKQISEQTEINKRVSELLNLDKILRKNFYSKFIGTTRKAVSLRGNQALTDNYLTVKNIPRQKGIFDVEIKPL
ncbi:MAG: MiaB/RimO family radical SAM methylthiotransferase [Endomicrobiaceae bacterium]|jgi:threonylcarbamoyladenosine tRNA methylthiotransferase MtaB|nr:MiaB/RimO family radical SAM methylthiotransferase [Endomicrobiaceae bacterium]MDD3730051.1 MiaB/RimO family radical SAM methylthiotransferase [Endomicrobiaceae bacterium]MDD4166562.1 MiaB/RimO family radical SAM methylthiotransferase [Endomicrobiaceae bacterium]